MPTTCHSDLTFCEGQHGYLSKHVTEPEFHEIPGIPTPRRPYPPDDGPVEHLPPRSLCLFPDDHPPSEFPADMEYGPVIHELAHACSRALPPAGDVASYLCDVVWPPVVYPDGAVDPNLKHV